MRFLDAFEKSRELATSSEQFQMGTAGAEKCSFGYGKNYNSDKREI